MAQDAATHYRNTIGAFTETIRISDFKANVAIVFTAIMMGPMISFRDKFPHYIPIALALAPFVLIYFCLLICLYPRYINEGRAQFIIQRNADPNLFQPPELEDHELDRQQTLCAILSRILWWKTQMLRISFFTCLCAVVSIAALVVFSML
jgi:hypothetical protein